MKAFVCKEFGPIESHGIEELPDPVAGDGQVVVDIKATGISFPDVLIVQGLYQFKPPFPFSPGSEISGIVSSVGSEVSQFKEGDRVMGNVGSGGLAEKGAFFENYNSPTEEEFKKETSLSKEQQKKIESEKSLPFEEYLTEFLNKVSCPY